MADPVFTLTTTNPFGLRDYGDAGWFYVNPVFADINGDGALDAFVGEYDDGFGVLLEYWHKK